jgi:nitronate monooxygenase
VADSSIGTFSLVRTILAAVDLPVIAAGGITDGAGIAAALTLGAQAVQVGTAYLRAEESAISAPWRSQLATVGDDATRLTRAISGRQARGIENEFMRTMRAVEDNVPAYPVQNALTLELRAAAAKQGAADVLSLWAGQSVALAKTGSAAEITHTLWRDAQRSLQATTQRWVGPAGIV